MTNSLSSGREVILLYSRNTWFFWLKNMESVIYIAERGTALMNVLWGHEGTPIKTQSHVPRDIVVIDISIAAWCAQIYHSHHKYFRTILARSVMIWGLKHVDVAWRQPREGNEIVNDIGVINTTNHWWWWSWTWQMKGGHTEWANTSQKKYGLGLPNQHSNQSTAWRFFLTGGRYGLSLIYKITSFNTYHLN